MLTLIRDFLFKPNVFGPAARSIIAGLRLCLGMLAVAVLDGTLTIPEGGWATLLHQAARLGIAAGLLHGTRIGAPQLERTAPKEPPPGGNIPGAAEKALGPPVDTLPPRG